MNKLEALQIKLEEARMVEANKRLKREELEELVAQAACPFHVNQLLVKSGLARTVFAVVESISYIDNPPHWKCNLIERSSGDLILGVVIEMWKPAPTTEPPF